MLRSENLKYFHFLLAIRAYFNNNSFNCPPTKPDFCIIMLIETVLLKRKEEGRQKVYNVIKPYEGRASNNDSIDTTKRTFVNRL